MNPSSMPALPDKFEKFCTRENLLSRDDRILLAVSGGIDSMVMAEIFRLLKYPIAIAHCNFRLRGEESDQDEAFVRQYAGDADIPVYVRGFDTADYAEEHRISVQMAARKLRYDWFQVLAKENDFSKIAVAHNLDDVAETILINLTRGTGLKGLTGIAPRKDRIIRPLLFASREEITRWAVQHNVKYREDSSNRTVKYVRNKIRHQIIPLFRELNPAFLQSVQETTIRLRGIEQFFSRYMDQNYSGFVQKFGERHVIPIAKLKETEAPEAVLFELLRPFRFPPPVTFEIIDALDGEAGKRFFSPTHRLIKDREHLIITPVPENNKSERFYIEDDVHTLTYPVILHLSRLKRTEDFTIPRSRNIAALDADRLQFPLILRKWHEGDWFIPLGLGGIKKLSDFFIDRKLSIDEKENTWLLTQGDEIIWVIGMQIDDRFKITNKTQNVLMIKYKR